MITYFPFEEVQRTNKSPLGTFLGPADPRTFSVHSEPSSIRVITIFTWLIATSTKICTNNISSSAHATAFHDVITSLYTTAYNAIGLDSVSCLSAIHFQGYFIRQVSCYTLLSGFRLPWPPPCCFNEATPFVGSDQQLFGTLARR